ncbi:MAG TPA: GNAT family N-acetyltransferase [Candidatus Paceibacterota bacterium]|nr:GNAT family N-acetyltransferase [Verrucomicrobiota bacterium]HRZ45413.1 GNAT family N-acetyltransferase [Candidatus Paceibacterota bacterium]
MPEAIHSAIQTPAGRPGPAGSPAPAPALQRVNPLEVPDWDALVRSHPDYTIFHGSAWARVLIESYGFEPVYVAAMAGGRLLALLPCMEVNSRLTGRRGVCLPFTDACPPLGSDSIPSDALLEELVAQGQERRWRSIECRGRASMATRMPSSLAYFGHSLDLAAGEDQLFAGFDGAVRRAIRKAEKCGVQVEVGDTLDAVRTYYALHCQTRRKHGLPPQPISFFDRLHRHVIDRKLGFVAIASFWGAPVAGVVILHFGTKAVFKYGASDASFQECRASNMAMWHAIRTCLERGCTILDFGRTSLENDGLRRYKLGWGAAEHRIEHIKYDLRRHECVTEHDRATGWHNRVFRLLPMRISRLIGAMLYPHIA